MRCIQHTEPTHQLCCFVHSRLVQRSPASQAAFVSSRVVADSSKRLEWLHDRMPVILRTREAQETWLQPGDNLG